MSAPLTPAQQRHYLTLTIQEYDTVNRLHAAERDSVPDWFLPGSLADWQHLKDACIARNAYLIGVLEAAAAALPPVESEAARG